MAATDKGGTFFSQLEFCTFGHRKIYWLLGAFCKQQHSRAALLNVLVTVDVQWQESQLHIEELSASF